MQRLAKPSSDNTDAWVRFPHPPPFIISPSHAKCYYFHMPMQVRDITNFMGVTNIKKVQPELPTTPVFDIATAGPRKVLLSWDTLTRSTFKPEKLASKKNRSMLIIGAVLALLLISMGEFLLIAVVASIVFIRHILAATPPRQVQHSLSTHGVDYSGEFYAWNELNTFYFTKDDKTDVLCVDTTERFPGRLFLNLKAGDKDKVKKIVGEYLTYLHQEPNTAVDKVFTAAFDKINLD